MFWRLCALLVAISLFAPMEILAQNVTLSESAYNRLLTLLNELNEDWTELHQISELQQTDLDQLTRQLEQSEKRLIERESELREIEEQLKSSEEQSSLLRLQLQQAEQRVAELRQEVERLRRLFAEQVEQTERMIARAERAERNLRIARWLVGAAAAVGFGVGFTLAR